MEVVTCVLVAGPCIVVKGRCTSFGNVHMSTSRLLFHLAVCDSVRCRVIHICHNMPKK